MNWTNDAALQEVTVLTSQCGELQHHQRSSAQHTQWRMRTLSFLKEVFGEASHYYATFVRYTWRAEQWHIDDDELIPGVPFDTLVGYKHEAANKEQLQSAYGLLLAATDEIRRKGVAGVFEGRDAGPVASELLRIIWLAEKKLRKVIRQPPKDELDVQNAFESLLVGADVPYSREKDHIEYSSKNYVPDFTFLKLNLAMDAKICNRAGREKEIIAEINDDILAYRTRYGNLLFVIYDLGFIRDVDLFASSFEEHDNVVVRVVKH